MSDNSNSEVGYKRPPVRTRFKKGFSGNPHGRPKKIDKSVGEILNSILQEKVSVTLDGQVKRITKEEFLIRKIVGQATTDPKALKMLMFLMNKYPPNASPAYLSAPIERATEEEGLEAIKQLLRRPSCD